jgi:23S rRNA G2445 N2-methylase RlmL
MVTALIYCNKGFEEVCKEEAREHVKCKCNVFSEIVICEVSSIEEVCKLAYKMQSACRVCLYLGKIETEKINSGKSNEKIIYDEKIFSQKKVAVKVLGFLETNEKTRELATKICKDIDNSGIKYSVDLKNPDVVIICFNSSDGIFVGIDFSGDLNKRDYQVFTHNQALRPTISYSLVELSGFDEKGILLDPFCGAGGVVIEAVLSHKKGIHAFDFDKLPFHRIVSGISYEEPIEKEQNEKKDDKTGNRIVGYDINLNTVTCARKNAKIAGINKEVEFSVVDVHFLDMKFGEKSVDYIVTHAPPLSKNTDERKILKLWDDFLFIAHDILTKKMVVLVNKTDDFKEIAKKYKFKILEEKRIFQGETQFFVLVLEK